MSRVNDTFWRVFYFRMLIVVVFLVLLVVVLEKIGNGDIDFRQMIYAIWGKVATNCNFITFHHMTISLYSFFHCTTSEISHLCCWRVRILLNSSDMVFILIMIITLFKLIIINIVFLLLALLIFVLPFHIYSLGLICYLSINLSTYVNYAFTYDEVDFCWSRVQFQTGQNNFIYSGKLIIACQSIKQ